MEFIEIIKAIILGIIEGITEWLPVSSTGHMILVDEFLQLNMSPAFKEMFFVVIQLGAIMAVVVLYWKKIFPFSFKKKPFVQKSIIIMWIKVIIACLPAAVIGLLFDDKVNELFYNFQTVAIMLILFGIFFIVVENYNKGKNPIANDMDQLTFKMAIIIGLFQVIAAVFPGTSRSGATIVGALILGISRTVAAEYTFFLAVPVMFGASLLKGVKFLMHNSMTSMECTILIVGMVVAFVVSLVVIKFLMGYIKKHDFKVFGWYRIVLGIIVLICGFAGVIGA